MFLFFYIADSTRATKRLSRRPQTRKQKIQSFKIRTANMKKIVLLLSAAALSIASATAALHLRGASLSARRSFEDTNNVSHLNWLDLSWDCNMTL